MSPRLNISREFYTHLWWWWNFWFWNTVISWIQYLFIAVACSWNVRRKVTACLATVSRAQPVSATPHLRRDHISCGHLRGFGFLNQFCLPREAGTQEASAISAESMALQCHSSARFLYRRLFIMGFCLFLPTSEVRLLFYSLISHSWLFLYLLIFVRHISFFTSSFPSLFCVFLPPLSSFALLFFWLCVFRVFAWLCFVCRFLLRMPFVLFPFHSVSFCRVMYV